MMGGPGKSYEHQKVPPPTGVGDVPRFLMELLGGFCTRYAYIVKLVWRTGWWILFLLSFIALFRGVTPVIGALISQAVLNELRMVVMRSFNKHGIAKTALKHFDVVGCGDGNNTG